MTTIANKTTTETSTAIATSALSKLIAESKVKAANSKPANQLPSTVEMLLQEGKSLTEAYEGWKLEFEEPSDKATWGLIDQVGGFVEKIENLKEEDQAEMKNQMRTDINERVPSSVNKSTTIEMLAVKFVFKNMIRQTAYNYCKALELARKAGKKSGGGIKAFIEAEKGIVNLIQKELKKEGKGSPKNGEASKERINSLREYFGLQAKASSVVEYTGDVLNCYDAEKAEKELKKEKDKQNKNKLKGSLVFLIGVPADDDGHYQVVQGSIFDQGFENSLIAQMSMALEGVDDADLAALVENLKSVQGFDGMRKDIE